MFRWFLILLFACCLSTDCSDKLSGLLYRSSLLDCQKKKELAHFRDMVRSMLCYNKKIKQAKAELEKSKAQYVAEGLGVLPTVSGNFGTSDSADYKLGVSVSTSVNLFSVYSDISAAQLNYWIASLSYREVVQEQVKTLFSEILSVLEAQKSIKYWEEVIDARKKGVQMYGERYKSGVSKRSEVSLSKSKLKKAVVSKIKVENEWEIGASKIFELTGVHLDGYIHEDCVPDLNVVKRDFVNANDASEFALVYTANSGNIPTSKSFLKLKISKRSVIGKAPVKPSVNASWGYGYQSALGESSYGSNYSAGVGVSISAPGVMQCVAAKKDVYASRHAWEVQKESVEQKMLEYYSTASSTVEEISEQKMQIKEQEKAIVDIRHEVSAGLRDNVDLLDMISDMNASIVSMFKMNHTLQTQFLEIMSSTGTLLEYMGVNVKHDGSSSYTLADVGAKDV